MSNSKSILLKWLTDALTAHHGSATIVEAAEYIWRNHEVDLRQSGDLFFTWQYDMRWAAYHLRKKGVMVPDEHCPQGIWKLAK